MRQRVLASCVLPLLFGGLGAPNSSAADLDSILDRNDEAHGGTAYARIESIRVELLISNPAAEVRGTYLATREGLMRIDFYAGAQRIFAEGVSNECAWSWNRNPPAGVRGGCVGEAEAAALRHGVELPGLFYTLKDVQDRGAMIQLIGPVGSESGPEWQLRLTLEDGFSRDYFIDQETNRITRARDFRAFQPALDPAEVLIETRFEAPEWFDGVLRFERQVNVNVNTGEILGTTTVLDLEFNPEVTEESFEAPAIAGS
jgi:hypothetical protein